MEPVKILIVDDSMFFREVLARGLKNRFPAGSIVEKAGDAFAAKDKILSFAPDVMILDVEMPNMNGIEFLRRLLVRHNIPTIVSSSRSAYRSLAMETGAFSFIVKPLSTLGSSGYMDKMAEEIRRAVRESRIRAAESGAGAPLGQESMGGIEMSGGVYRRSGRVDKNSVYRDVTHSNIKMIMKTVKQIAAARGENREPLISVPHSHIKAPVPPRPVQLIAIGASTGGTEALSAILKALRPPLPPIVIVQHIPPMFSKLFSDRLHNECHVSVKEAENGDRLENGWVYVAPGDKQMMVKRLGDIMHLDVNYGPKVNGHCPSVDVLFNSVAERVGDRAMGVILTGMGEDGARGLLKMREAGSVTLGQDEASCVVYGMPRAAYEKGAVVQQVPLSAMADMITDVARHQGRS